MKKIISIEIDKELGDAFEKIVGESNISNLLERYIKVYTIERQSSENDAIASRCTPIVCEKCGMPPNEYGQDYCIANLGNVMNACCGHGEEGYIQFDNGITIRGHFNVEHDGEEGKLYPMKNIEVLQYLTPDKRLDFLAEFIGRWAGLESKDGSYTHDLTRVKDGYQYGTVDIDDFVEWDDDRVMEVSEEILEWLNEESNDGI